VFRRFSCDVSVALPAFSRVRDGGIVLRAVSLLSGGLDSILATKAIIDQGIEVTALNFVSVFCTCTPKSSCCSAARSAVNQLGIGLEVANTSEEFLKVVKNPKHGYGSQMNPCIDCRILMFRHARDYMERHGASFVVTGEVLGERPMSQRREVMKLIEKEAGLEGLVVRPLSAALLDESIPESMGWVDRAKLLGIRGRSRKPQIALAKDYGIADYPCPAGGCRLTDPGFARRMKDLMKYAPDFTLNDVQLLMAGRHFRLSPQSKGAMGRDDEENKKLRALAREEDMLLEAADFPGPLTVLRGRPTAGELLLSAAVTAGYGKAHDQATVKMTVSSKGAGNIDELTVEPVASGTLAMI
jgi:tRNA U34 2-thiouridine synthase MnmA/TrmU